MPLIKGEERKNIVELNLGGIGPTRHKAIRTIMKRRKISYEKARDLQAKAIAKNL